MEDRRFQYKSDKEAHDKMKRDSYRIYKTTTLSSKSLEESLDWLDKLFGIEFNTTQEAIDDAKHQLKEHYKMEEKGERYRFSDEIFPKESS